MMIERRRNGESGFSLIETVIAMAILATGLLSLAGVFAMGLRNLAGSSANLIAREKAREAVESVHTARDTRVITFAQIKNVAHGGVFVNGPTGLRKPGVDGLVNTADDLQGVTGLETMLGTGPRQQSRDRGRRRDADDHVYAGDRHHRAGRCRTRCSGRCGSSSPTQVQNTTRSYTLTTFVSSIS